MVYKRKGLKVNLIELLSTGLYIGYVPVAPGSFGSIWAIPLGVFLSTLSPLGMVIAGSVLILLSIYLSGEAEVFFGREDPGEVVVDEIVAFSILLYFLPFRLIDIFLSFLIFRLVDIVKPFPIRWFEERFSGGWVVVADDLMASILTYFIWYGSVQLLHVID